jgi:chromosome segregation ATPase
MLELSTPPAFDKFGPLPTIRSMPKKINIDELAEMNQREFAAMREEMRTGFEAVDHRFEGLDHRFQAMDSRFDSLTNILKAMREDLKEIKSDVTTVNLDYVELRARVYRLEKKAGFRD